MKVPWYNSDSITKYRIEHFQHVDGEPEDEAPAESKDVGRPEEADLPTRYPYPRFWEIEEEHL